MTKSTTKASFNGEYQPIMLAVAKPANRPNGISEAQEDDSYPEGAEANGGTATVSKTVSRAHGHNGPQDLETIAREAGLDDSAVNTCAFG